MIFLIDTFYKVNIYNEVLNGSIFVLFSCKCFNTYCFPKISEISKSKGGNPVIINLNAVIETLNRNYFSSKCCLKSASKTAEIKYSGFSKTLTILATITND
tara:strand:+ start:9098 stop:9400 length:303 start_codon:yes stop_codon:yes gene_type:complete